MNGRLALVITVLTAAAVLAAASWVYRKLLSGPGPRSRLERLLDGHERDEAERQAREAHDEEAAS